MKKQAQLFLLIFFIVGATCCNIQAAADQQGGPEDQITQINESIRVLNSRLEELSTQKATLRNEIEGTVVLPQKREDETREAYFERVTSIVQEKTNTLEQIERDEIDIQSEITQLRARLSELYTIPEDTDEAILIEGFKQGPVTAPLYEILREKERVLNELLQEKENLINRIPSTLQQAEELVRVSSEISRSQFEVFQMLEKIRDKVSQDGSGGTSKVKKRALEQWEQEVLTNLCIFNEKMKEVDKLNSLAQAYHTLAQEGKFVAQETSALAQRLEEREAAARTIKIELEEERAAKKHQNFNKNLVIGVLLGVLVESLLEKSWIRRGAHALWDKGRRMVESFRRGSRAKQVGSPPKEKKSVNKR